MCGIAGFFQLQGQTEPNIDLIGKMIKKIEHRGPDEYGVLFDKKAVLGHARLSIIDLSGGSQPLSNEDNSVWIVFNGEIYNYIELRNELQKAGHKFRTHSDTEIIVHAYEEYGTDCVKHFNGQFAFCIYDKKRESLFISRDRFGIRPLFYTVQNQKFYFGSEIKTIFVTRKLKERLIWKVSINYLPGGQRHPPKQFLRIF